MEITSYKIDGYKVQIYANDKKGGRTRWGDKAILLYSGGECVAQAVFSCDDTEIPEPYISSGKIYYFAPSSQYSDVIDLLRNEKPVYIAWKPVSDPKETRDGDAYFYTE